MHMLYISRHVHTHVSKHLLYFWTTSTVVFRAMYKFPHRLLCNKTMLCLKERIATSLITNKLFNSYTLLPSSVSCVQVSNHKRAELSDFYEKTFNPGQTHDEYADQSTLLSSRLTLQGVQLYCSYELQKKRNDKQLWQGTNHLGRLDFSVFIIHTSLSSPLIKGQTLSNPCS